MSEDRIL